ncbi:LON peptidase N-terminal domain and RING finger protein 2-like [Teleopsis dalmanni]|uniref:LON peptidase N-terminal domain and RING finger protein 2-like n=1 Tax=Teleopsis dalmanni TaxID=139649 RepID=UPI0018CDF99C|nr:LON peptidase N-terminal domain and RING finger protein 2-like [Teleopsis dalmanni]
MLFSFQTPTNFKSLLLRAEVLRKLNHFQSSLADVENALKIRYTSAKAHYLRALALSELGRFDEALYDNCLAISLDKAASLTTTELFQHDLSKTLQKFLAQSQKSKLASHRCFSTTSPYSVLAEQRLRRKQMALLRNADEDHINAMDEDFLACSKKCDIIADEEEVLAAADYHSTYPSIGKDYDVSLRRHPMRKHFRRKWIPKETELLPTVPLDELRCSTQFCNIIERTQQELQRLRKLESSSSQLSKQLMQVPTNLIDASDFDCVLCCRTLWKPVVTPCGHTYCRVCLDRCMDYTSSCPLCMSPLVEPNVNQLYQGASSPVPLSLAKRPVTKFLEAAMKRFIPDSYEKRSRQEMNMEPSVPVFICTTAFPHVACPLFVYEPRYRLMVRRAVESGEKQFGIVQPHKGKSRYYDVGTILDIRDCVMLRDGCSILSTVGCKRFKILTRNEKDGYETAKVEYIYDETISDENVKFVSAMHASVRAKAIDWFESLGTEFKQEILQSFGEMPAVEDNWENIADGPAWAWWIIALLPLNPHYCNIAFIVQWLTYSDLALKDLFVSLMK